MTPCPQTNRSQTLHRCARTERTVDLRTWVVVYEGQGVRAERLCPLGPSRFKAWGLELFALWDPDEESIRLALLEEAL